MKETSSFGGTNLRMNAVTITAICMYVDDRLITYDHFFLLLDFPGTLFWLTRGSSKTLTGIIEWGERTNVTRPQTSSLIITTSKRKTDTLRETFSLLSSVHALVRVGDVEEEVVLMVLLVEGPHGGGGGRDHVVHEEEQGVLGAEGDSETEER